MPAARAARGGHHGTRSSGSTRAVEDGHRRRGGGNRGRARVARAAQAVKWSAGTEAPKLKAPANATRLPPSHLRRAFPVDPKATLRPADALVEDYRALQKRIGTTRNVIVQPSTYGIDNRCTLDALAAIGPTARAVAVVNDTRHGRRAQAHARARRARHPLQPGPGRRDDARDARAAVEAGQRRSAGTSRSTRRRPRSWRSCRSCERVPSPIVFDHLAHIPQPAGVNDPLYAKVLALIDKGRTWVKLSGAYADTKVGPPTYADSSAVAQRLRQGGARAMRLGQRLAAPDREGQAAGRRAALRPARRLGARREGAATASWWRTRRCSTASSWSRAGTAPRTPARARSAR